LQKSTNPVGNIYIFVPMKGIILLSYIRVFAILLLFFFSQKTFAQSNDDLLNLLINKGTITKNEADSIKKSYIIKQKIIEAKQDATSITLGKFFRLSGYTQIYYTHYQQSGKYGSFSVKRARLDLQGDFSHKWNYRLLADFVGNSGANGSAQTGGALISPMLLEGYIAYKPFNFLKITAGQFIVPFSLENMTQDKNLELIDRAQVVNALVSRKGDASNGLIDSLGNQNGRDIGVQVSGNLFENENKYLLDYYIALFNGAGINTLDNNQSKDIAARIAIHPVKGFDIGASYYNGFDKFTSSLTKSQNRIRLGFDMAYTYKLFSLKSEYIKGKEGNNKVTNHEGWYAQAGYFILPKQLQAVFKYDAYNSNTTNSSNKSVYYVYGLTYFFNTGTKFQLNYSQRTEALHIKNDVFTAQLQLAF
jgi:phosphate-selective porin OprO and OprP